MEKQEISKRGFWEILLPALFLSFTFFIFGPLELYISNIAEFWFSLGDVLWPSVLAGFLVCMLLFLVGIFLRGNWREYYICLLIGVGVALYIQGNFVKTDYGVLDGRAIQWENYTSTAIWNTLLWIACIVLPFVGRTLFKKQYKTGVTLVSGCVLLVQMITLGTLLATTDFSKNKNDDFYLSTKNLFTVSRNKNIVVFVLDTFDQRYLEEILRETPEIADLFDGFTSYSNAVSSYPFTKTSMPLILTGQYYKNEQPYNEYITEAYRNADYYRKLQNKGFDIGIYTNDFFISDETKGMFLTNGEKGRTFVKSSVALEKAMLQFCGFRYFPHILKQYVWFYSGIFDELKATSVGDPHYLWDNIDFYESLKEEGLTILPDGNAYRLIHLEGTHPPVTLNGDITVAKEGQATPITQGRACLNIISEYLEQLKKYGIYDHTMIVVTADHGELGHRSFPMFMIKDFEERGKLQTSEIPINNSDLMPTILDSIGGDRNIGNSVSIYDEESMYKIDRKYYWHETNEPNVDYLPDMIEYDVIEGEDFCLTGDVYTKQGIQTFKPYIYEIGDTILFNKDYTRGDYDLHPYFQSGISHMEWNNGSMSETRWSEGKRGKMRLNIGQTEDLIGEIQVEAVYEPPQRLIIYSNGKTLYNKEVFSTDSPITFKISKDCIQQGVLDLDLEYPDALSPASQGKSADSRELAFRFKSFSFDKDTEQ